MPPQDPDRGAPERPAHPPTGGVASGPHHVANDADTPRRRRTRGVTDAVTTVSARPPTGAARIHTGAAAHLPPATRHTRLTPDPAAIDRRPAEPSAPHAPAAHDPDTYRAVRDPAYGAPSPAPQQFRDPPATRRGPEPADGSTLRTPPGTAAPASPRTVRVPVSATPTPGLAAPHTPDDDRDDPLAAPLHPPGSTLRAPPGTAAPASPRTVRAPGSAAPVASQSPHAAHTPNLPPREPAATVHTAPASAPHAPRSPASTPPASAPHAPRTISDPPHPGPDARTPRDPASDPPTTTTLPGARDPSGPALAAPSLDPEDLISRPFAIGSGVLALALLGLLAWSRLAFPPPRVIPTTVAAAPAPAVEVAEDAPPPVLRPRAPAVARAIDIDPPRQVPGLAQLSLGLLQSGGRLSTTTLGRAMGKRIAVINVWATYCAPCMREMPRLLDLLDTRAWGNDLRFVPILLEAPDEQNARQRDMLRTLRDAPTTSKHALVDLTPAGALQTLLHEEGMLPDRATLPVTLVLDCEQRLRWLHLGELTDAAPLADRLEELRRELPRCAPEPAPVEPTPTTGCGDGYCVFESGEDCGSCPTDCACPADRECNADPGHRGRCVPKADALKD